MGWGSSKGFGGRWWPRVRYPAGAAGVPAWRRPCTRAWQNWFRETTEDQFRHSVGGRLVRMPHITGTEYEVGGLPRRREPFFDRMRWAGGERFPRRASRSIWRRMPWVRGFGGWADRLEMMVLPSGDGGDRRGESLPGYYTRYPRLQILPFRGSGGFSCAARQVSPAPRLAPAPLLATKPKRAKAQTLFSG